MSAAEIRFYLIIAVIVLSALTVLHAGLISVTLEGRCVG